jgi:hypothetical protein
MLVKEVYSFIYRPARGLPAVPRESNPNCGKREARSAKRFVLSWCDQKREGLCDQNRNNAQSVAFAVAVPHAGFILSVASAEDRALRGRNLSAA